MREYDRIKRITDMLCEIWQSKPYQDLRFWQLISCLEVEYGHNMDLFYLEDDATEKFLQKVLDNCYYEGDDNEG